MEGGNRLLSLSLDETTIETVEATIGREETEEEKQRGSAWNFHLAAVRNYAEGRNRGRNRVRTRK